MAPQPPPRPSARTLRHQRITGQVHPLLPQKVFRPTAKVSEEFTSNKRDKRLMRHSSFVSRVQASGVSKAKKRRRPSKKLAADLDALADALPEVGEAEDGKIRHKSLKSRKGALKRKEMVVKGEMERFGASMARLTNVPETASSEDAKGSEQDGGKTPAPVTSNRWAALRGYISSTMEQNPAFTGKN